MVELDLQLRRGSFTLSLACSLASPWTVVFGPSGTGKSTLLRLISGLDQPDRGRIHIHGACVTDTGTRLYVRAGSRSTGLVTQRPALFPHLSVQANVGYGLASLPQAQRAERVQAMLQLTGAGELIHRPVRALSGGEAQRVALARALAPLPRLLLLDEPLSALGAAARDEMLNRLQAWLSEQNIQTILVTHDAVDALSTEAEVAYLENGRLTALGPARLVLAAERERLLARLDRHEIV